MIIIQQKTKQAKQTNKQKNIFAYHGSPIKSDLVSRSKNWFSFSMQNIGSSNNNNNNNKKNTNKKTYY